MAKKVDDQLQEFSAWVIEKDDGSDTKPTSYWGGRTKDLFSVNDYEAIKFVFKHDALNVMYGVLSSKARECCRVSEHTFSNKSSADITEYKIQNGS